MKKWRLPTFTVICLAAAAAFFALSPREAVCADFTDVADASDDIDIFDLKFETNFFQKSAHALVLRERNVMDVRGTKPGDTIDQAEYDYWHSSNVLNMKLSAGLYKDLEFHLIIPIVISQTDKYVQSEHWRSKYWGGFYDVNENNHGNSLIEDTVAAGGDHITNAARDEFGIGGHLDDITIGFSYSVFNCERDYTKPTWTLYFDMTLPTASMHNPKNLKFSTGTLPQTHSNEPGLGAKLLTFKLGTAVSKRYKAFDPYVGLFFDLPAPVGDSLVELPQFKINFILGSEIVFWERKKPDSPDARHKIYMDFRATNTLVTEGDGYPLLTDMLAWRAAKTPNYRLPREESFVRSEGMIAIKFQIYDYVKIQGFGTITHDFDHFLSVTTKYLDGEARPDPNDYYSAVSEPGKRIKMGQHYLWSWGIGMELAF